MWHAKAAASPLNWGHRVCTQIYLCEKLMSAKNQNPKVLSRYLGNETSLSFAKPGSSYFELVFQRELLQWVCAAKGEEAYV